MFQIQDSFIAYDKNKQPYSFTVERHTETDNFHAGVIEEGFSLKSVGNRHILNTPKFHTGTFFAEFKATFLKEFDPEFLLLFHYQEEVRKGEGIRIRCRLDGLLEMELVSVEGSSIVVQAQKSFTDFYLSEESFLPLTLEIREDRISCCVDTKEAVFSILSGAGRLAIERSNFIGELILKKIAFESRDEFQSRIIIPQVTAEIPLINGGDIPYTLTWQLEEVEGEFYLRCALDGGTKTRPVNREDRMGQYATELDWMETPYVGIRNFGQDHIYNISEGMNCFVDPNIFWDCLKEYFNDTELPIRVCYKVNVPVIDEQAEIIFEDANGEIDTLFEEDLPYDLNAEVIELDDTGYGMWYLDSLDHLERYIGKKICFTAMVLLPDGFQKGYFVPGRMAMTCCADDMAFLGFACKWDGAGNLQQRDWVKVTAEVRKEYWEDYKGEGPVLYATKVEQVKAPKKEIIDFT